MNRTVKFSFTLSVITILLVVTFIPLQVSADGVYNNSDWTWTDTFTSNSSFKFIDGTSECDWINNDTIVLSQTSTAGRVYDFKDGGSHEENDHKAYYFQAFMLRALFDSNIFPKMPNFDELFYFRYKPASHTARETQFGDEFYYPAIEHANETADPYAQSSANGINNLAIQHFRFKLQGTANTIGALDIYWEGKTANAKEIRLYYWRNAELFPKLSRWTLIHNITATGDVILRKTVDISNLDQPFDKDNYFDILVVAVKEKPLSKCTLFTDYVKIKATQQTGYKIGYGLVQTRCTVNLSTNTYWDLLTWEDYESGSATVKYQILYDNGSNYVPFKDTILPGNEQGFTTPPISLVSLSNVYPQIKIQANLTTKDPSITPKIFKWVLAWQNKNQWQDNFISEYRIGQKNKLTFKDGAVNISLVSGDWPMFGQNPTNNRVMDGPAATTGALYWYSTYHELRNQTLGNPIVDGESLYIIGTDTESMESTLYKIPNIIVPSGQVGEPYTGTIPIYSSIGQSVVGTPAISDKYIVFSTGDLNSENYVYVLDKSNASNLVWKFDYSIEVDSEDPQVCYWGSPVISDGLIYLTAWSGDPLKYHVNNMLLVLDPTNKKIWPPYHFPEPSRPLQSPTWSFSTPAVSEDGIVVVGCMNNAGENLFAFQKQETEFNFTLLWNISVNGAIGKSAPVIYNDTVYIVNEYKKVDGIRRSTNVTAVNLNDGTIKWTVPLGRIITTQILDPTLCLAQSTPAIANGNVYVTSPDGTVTAVSINGGGSKPWSQEVYSWFSVSSPILSSSPAYADGILYVGSPNGSFYALNTNDNGKVLWHKLTYPNGNPVVTDPIVTNGIVFYAGENGRLYARGSYVKPDKEISGSITSVPITLPTGAWWKKFYAQVQTNSISTINKITFSILDEDGNFLKEVSNKSDILLSNQTIGRTIRLHADLWAKNTSVNPRLFFWNVTFEPDVILPYINRSTLTPNPTGYLNEVVPVFTVNAQDNNTGLLVSSARYTLDFILDDQNKHETYSAFCTGVNGTTAEQLITVNLTKLSFYSNITELKHLWINISDLAGNKKSLDVPIKQDKTKPNSSVLPRSMRQRYNATTPSIRINATSFDNGTDPSGVQRVDLYYRYSSTGNFSGVNWIYYTNSTRKNPTWQFNLSNKQNQNGGYFELCTIATDNASNTENFSTRGDVSFQYDWDAPDLPQYSGTTLWFKERPSFSVVFRDDYRLHTIQYHPNFDNDWTTIGSHPVNKSSYTATWILAEEYWDEMEEGEQYYLYFKINDTLGNIRLITSNTDAITIRKDISNPTVIIDAPTVDTDISWSENFTISALVNDQEGSGISEVTLYYRYSEDKSNWTSWTQYGDTLGSAPFEWEFNAEEGDGYYEFKVNVTDLAGNQAESEVFSSGVNSFPTNLVLIMAGLVVVLLLVSVVIFIKWRKRKQ